MIIIIKSLLKGIHGLYVEREYQFTTFAAIVSILIDDNIYISNLGNGSKEEFTIENGNHRIYAIVSTNGVSRQMSNVITFSANSNEISFLLPKSYWKGWLIEKVNET